MEGIMEYIERDPRINTVGYESMVWVRDDSGREFSCSLDTARGGVGSVGDLTEHERASCMDVNLILGDERW
jgi:hypothetical protein